MDLKRLPPSMLVALGLAAAQTAPGCVVSSCLDVSPVGEGTNSSSEGSGSTGDGSTSSTVGPCLDVAPMTSSTTSTVGPCLGAPGTDSGAEGTSSGTSGGDTDSGSGTSTGGAAMGDATPEAKSMDRTSVIGRLLDAGVLPDDVATRLAEDADD